MLPLIRFPRRRGGLAIAASAAMALGAAGLPATAPAAYTNAGGVSCDEAVTQAFAEFADSNWYALAPAGDFESGADGWTAAKGATVVAGSEPYAITGTLGRQAMSLPAGGSITSPDVCVDPTRETFRFFVRNTSNTRARVKVEALFKTGARTPGRYLAGYVTTDVGVWTPSPIMRNAASRFVDAGTKASVQYRFTAENGSMVVDDVHVDPRMTK